MGSIFWRTQLRLVGAGYGVVALVSAGLIFVRYLQYARHPGDAAAYSTMWGFGDWMLEFFILGLFLVPTFFLLLVIAKSEPASLLYSKLLLAFSLTMPLSIGLFFIPAVAQGWMPGIFCLYRVLGSPVVLVGMLLSRVMARFPRAKRLTSYSLLVETGTLVLTAAVLTLPAKMRGN
ncbi:MAG: hypothetical protein WBM11_17145 [Terriglobales bacterium]